MDGIRCTGKPTRARCVRADTYLVGRLTTSVTHRPLPAVLTLNLTATAGIRWSNASLEAADPTRD